MHCITKHRNLLRANKTEIFFFCFSPGPAQFKMCYDNAATDCNGSAVVNLTTAMECCLSDGYWFDDEVGQCHQCIGKQMLVRAIHVEMYPLLHCFSV